MANKFTMVVVGALVAGIAAGSAIHAYVPDEALRQSLAGYCQIGTDLFLRLIKMIIAPLVLSTLTVGIAHMGDPARLGRVGVRTLAWFILASLISLALGLFMVTWIAPGVGAGFALPVQGAGSAVTVAAITLKDFVTHLVPKSIVEAMAGNEILQIVVFSLFLGTALAALGERVSRLVGLLDDLAHAMLKMTSYVMLFAPVAVFAAITAVVAQHGFGVLATYGRFVGGFYLSLLVLWTVLLLLGAMVLGRRAFKLVPLLREPVLLAFSTASSEAAYPKTLEQLSRFGVSDRIASFVLPLGYSFNLDGSMMYCTFATMFIAQAYGISLTLSQQVTMLLLLMVTSKGMAGVPRASLVVIAATLTHFGIPEAGLVLILAVDQFLDMGRSATNVIGNSVATAVVAAFEGELKTPAAMQRSD
ncbi:MAG: dicarboxylate/amino acid:cation symporter [Pseudomonadota bacterium]|jgi:Na+/H+-dicarboxylate symporter